MTIAELIQSLQSFPQNLKVHIGFSSKHKDDLEQHDVVYPAGRIEELDLYSRDENGEVGTTQPVKSVFIFPDRDY